MKSGISSTGIGNNNLFRRLFIVLLCLFVIMVGFGVLMPVLPFYTEAVFQPVIAHYTKSGFIKQQLFTGILISGLSIFLLPFTDKFLLVNILIAFMAFGMAVVTPNLLTAISLHNNRKTGQNLAALNCY